MIARIWRGVTLADKADAHIDHLEATGLKEYRATDGNRGVFVLRRALDEGRAEFLLLSLWDSFETIRAFVGPEMERAVYYPEDREFLLEQEPGVAHYEVARAP